MSMLDSATGEVPSARRITGRAIDRLAARDVITHQAADPAWKDL
jgi:hypothetical protein